MYKFTDDEPSLIGAWSSHVTHKIFFGSNHITGSTAEPKLVKFCTQVGCINYSNRMTYHPITRKSAWLWSRDCFKILLFAVMQRVARVWQRQLSYLYSSACICLCTQNATTQVVYMDWRAAVADVLFTSSNEY